MQIIDKQWKILIQHFLNEKILCKHLVNTNEEIVTVVFNNELYNWRYDKINYEITLNKNIKGV